MTDLGITKITIKKGQGLTHALRDLVKEKNMVMSDGSISKAEWNNTMDKLAELQAKRSAEGKASIFTGGTNKTDYRTSFVVHPNQQIDFTEEEMNELYNAMGVSFAETEKPAEPEAPAKPAAPSEPAEPEAPADSASAGGTNITVGNGNGTTVIIDGDENGVIIGKADKPAKPEKPEEPVAPPAPEEPEAPVAPAAPSTPEEPEAPATPAVPSAPEEPEEPATGSGDTKTDVKVGNGNGTTVIIIGDDNTVIIGDTGKPVTGVENPDEVEDPDEVENPDEVEDPDEVENPEERENPTNPDGAADKNKTIIDTLKDVILKLLGLIKADDVEPVKPKDKVEPEKPAEPAEPQKPENPEKPQDTTKLTYTTLTQKLIEIIKQLLELIQAQPIEAKPTEDKVKNPEQKPIKAQQGWIDRMPYRDYNPKNPAEDFLNRLHGVTLTETQKAEIRKLESQSEMIKYLKEQGIEVTTVY